MKKYLDKYFYFTLSLPCLINIMFNLILFYMETERKKLEITKELITERNFLLLPNEEITFKVKVSTLSTLRFWFEPVKIDVAKSENYIELY